MSKNRNVKGSNIPSINLNKELITLLTRLDAEEVKEIIVGIRDYVYKDKEPIVNEEITDIMDMVLDNINFIAKGYLNGKKGGRPKKSALQEVKETEFDTPKQEIENKPILNPQIIQDDNLYHPDRESASNGLKVGKNEVLDNEPKVLPNVKLVATAQTPSIPTFEEYLQDEKNNIESIIKDFNAGGTRATLQAPENLKDLLNRKWGRYYKEQITEYINNRRVA